MPLEISLPMIMKGLLTVEANGSMFRFNQNSVFETRNLDVFGDPWLEFLELDHSLGEWITFHLSIGCFLQSLLVDLLSVSMLRAAVRWF